MDGIGGLSAATRRVADHARSIVRLEIQLATAELKRKMEALGTGLAFSFAAAVLAFLALCLALAGAAAALSLVLPVWASLLVVGGAVLLVGAIFAAVGVTLLRKNSNPVPEQAVEEAQLTSEALRNGQ
jgi:Putative Actinobacterial Holin-X, holin superfamily III